MGAISNAANAAFADGPASLPSMPPKADIRAVFATIDQKVGSLEAGYDVSYATRAELFADLAWTAGKIGRVFGDATVAFRGIYKKAGASGAGSWAKIGDLPTGDVTAADLSSAVAAEAAARNSADATEAAARNSADVSILSIITASNTGINAQLSSLFSADTAQTLALNRRFDGDPKRPGDSPLSFTTSLANGDPALIAPLTQADTVEDARGREVLLSASRPLIATREKFALEIGHKYRIRAVAQRRVGTPDPNGDAVQVRVGWYDRFKNALPGGSALTVIETLSNLTVGSGAAFVEKVIALSAGDDVDFVAPADAVYGVAYVYQYGSVPTTAVQVLDVQDISELESINPDLSTLEGQVAGLLSLDAGDRLEALESAVGTPNKVVFLTVADGIGAGSIDAAVDYVETLGYTIVGLGGRTYKRVGSIPAHPFFITIGGAHFESTAPRDAIYANGQSNFTINVATYAHTLPPNYCLWNWNGTQAGVGTAFTAAPTATIGGSVAAAKAHATRHPDRDVFLINIAFGGQSIDHWTYGLTYKFETSTAEASATAGKIVLNHATPASATQLTVNIMDSRGVFRLGALSVGLVGANTLRIVKASNPAVYYDYTVAAKTDGTVSLTYESVITWVGGNGTIADDDEVYLKFGPDIYDTVGNNVPAALAIVGKTHPDYFAHWQIESEAPAYTTYADDFETFWARLVDDDIVDHTTPAIIVGQVGNQQFSNPNYVHTSHALQEVVGRLPDTRTYVNINDLPASYWDGSKVHMTGPGYEIVGERIAKAFDGLAVRATMQGSTVNPETGQIWISSDGTVALPALTPREMPSTGWWADRSTAVQYGTKGDTGYSHDGVEVLRFHLGKMLVAGDIPRTPYSAQAKINGSATGITGFFTGDYVRKDGLVTVTTHCVFTSKGAGSGPLTFDAPLALSGAMWTPLRLTANLLVSGVGDTYLSAQIQPGESIIRVSKMVGGVLTALTNADINDNSQFFISGDYRND